jgi:hypothetical protein
MRSTLLKAVVFAAALSSIGDGWTAGAPIAVPPAEFRPSAITAKAATALIAPAAVATRRIVLPPVADSERAALRQQNLDLRKSAARSSAKSRPVVIGFPRDVPATASSIDLARLDWLTMPDGGRVARIELKSPTAEALRLLLSLEAAHPDVALRFKGSARRAEAYGPYAANALVEATKRHGRFLTPVLEGETATIELHAGPGASVDGAVLTIGVVSHLVAAGESLRTLDPKRAEHIGLAASCNIDFACVTPSTVALAQAANAVGKLVMTRPSGVTVACTGTMLNDSVSSLKPYLLTANHCVAYFDTPYDDAAFIASTANVYWFFRAVACNSLQIPPYALQDGGAMLLARSDDWEWALLRMFTSPPAGVAFAAWRAEPLPPGAIGTTLHHPRGDLLMFSQGIAQGDEPTNVGSLLTGMRWSQGTTEIGSSGAGLFTFLGSGGYYEVRGSLYGGEASCGNPNGIDHYTRLDSMLPLVRQYLTPDAENPSAQAVAVEYYSPSLDQYFITIDPNEINLLDTGVLVGWERTGIRFLAYSTQQPGTNPVCRYYLKPELGDAHFYSADRAECERVLQQFGHAWMFEASNVFYVAMPDPVTGACPSGTKPIWRFTNTRKENHRYTPEVTIRDELRFDPIWMAEGYGPDATVMCSPASN